MVELDQVLDCEEDGAERVFNNFFAHMASSCDWHGVSVDHAEALLVDAALRLGISDLFFAMVADSESLESGIHNEARFKVVNMFALRSLGLVINIGVDSAVVNLGQFSVDIESEGAELADIDGVATTECLVKVGDETTPDDQHLRFGFKRLLVSACTLSGIVVLSRVLVSILKNPLKHKS
jgi:hypothetical protein